MNRIDNMTAGSWSQKEIETAAHMWKIDGLSALKIAGKMGKSRSSVLGLAHRNRGMFPARAIAHSFHAIARQHREAVKRETVERKPAEPIATPYELNIVPLPFARISRGRCMFPMPDSDGKDGPDMLCCGMPSMDRHAMPGDRKASNCEMHFNIGNAVRRVTNNA